MIESSQIKIQPVDNGWILNVLNAEDYTGARPTVGIHVFTNPKDLGRFVEDFYTKKDEH